MGIEPLAETAENNTLRVEGGAKPGALTGQAHLIYSVVEAVIDAGPTLPEPIRAAILALHRAANV